MAGLNLFDESGLPVGQLGVPNDKPCDAAVYPIPATGTFTVFVEARSVDKTYTIPSICDDQDILADVPTLLEDHPTYTVADLEAAAGTNVANTYNIPGISQSVGIDRSLKSAGLNRVFILKTDGELLWYNTYLDPSTADYADFSFFEMSCL